jgi:hypothetical protein
MKKFLFIFCILFFLFNGYTFGRLGDSEEAKMEIYAEEGLKDTTKFINSINGSVSNYGDEGDSKIYKRIILRFLNAKKEFLKFNFGVSVKEIKKAQRLLIVLYKKTLDSYYKRSRARLFKLMAKLLVKKRVKLQKLLGLALRDIENAKIKKTLGDNIDPQLYSNKIYYYIESLKYINHSMRFYIIIRLKFDAIYPLETENKDFNEIENNIFTGFPKNSEELRKIHYNSHFKSFIKPSEKERIWAAANDYSSLKVKDEFFNDIENPPVRDGKN